MFFKSFKKWYGPHCSCVPDFDIGYICKAHDNDYDKAGTWRGKFFADVQLFKKIVNHGMWKHQFFRYAVLAVIYFIGLQTFGWLFFIKAKFFNRSKT